MVEPLRTAILAADGTLTAYSEGLTPEMLAPLSYTAQRMVGLPAGVLWTEHLGRYETAVARSTSTGFDVWIFSRLVLAWRADDPVRAVEHLPALSTPLFNLPYPPVQEDQRAVGYMQRVLKEGNSPMLLGALQALVDGAKLVFVREQPDPELVRQLWALLPCGNREEVTFATFTTSPELLHDLVLVPTLPDPVPIGYITEDQMLEYPEGRYEKNLQIAIEADDQHEIYLLMGRRTNWRTFRLCFWVLGAAMIVGILTRILVGPPANLR